MENERYETQPRKYDATTILFELFHQTKSLDWGRAKNQKRYC